MYWRRQWQPTPVLLPGNSHGWRSPVGCSPWSRKESDTTERLHFHFPLLCTGEGNGNPLQCSCLENPRDGGAWWAAIYVVVQSDTTEATLQQQHASVGDECSFAVFLILWHCLSLGLDWKLTFSNPVAAAEFSKFAGILSAALSQHHLLGFELTELESHHLH